MSEDVQIELPEGYKSELKEVDGTLSYNPPVLMGSCHMCGKCCEAIHIPFTPEQIHDKRKWGSEFKFVDENWVPMTKEQAFEINPHFTLMESRGADYSKMSWYSCKQHDKETKLCKIHDDRPYVCSGYPWYDGPPRTEEAFYSMDCGYKVDVEKEWKYK